MNTRMLCGRIALCAGCLAFCLALGSPASAIDVRIDFAANSVTGNPGGDWNTLSSAGGSIPDMTDFATGTGSSVSLTVTDNLSGPGNSNAGQWSGTPEFPSWVDAKTTNDYFFAQAPANPTGQIEFAGAGLDLTKTYRVEVLGSRSFGGTYGDYQINGTLSDNRNSDDYEAYANGYVGHEVMTWRSVAPDGSGKITLDLYNVEASVATYLSAMRISDTQSILFDLGRSEYQTSGNWNNAISLLPGQKVVGAVDAGGQQTEVGLSVIESFQDINPSGIASDAAGFPASAQRDSFAVAGTNIATVQIESLVPGQQYDVTLFGSRSTVGGTNNRTGAYTIGGTTKNLLNEGNTTETVTFYDVAADQNGNIQIDAAVVDEFGYLGVIEVVGNFETPALPPQPSIFVDFGDGTYPTMGNWNNITSTSGSVIDAVNSLGEITDVDVVITQGFAGYQVGVASNDAGFPTSAQRDNFYIHYSGNAAVQFEDLAPGALYDLTVFGSRAAGSPRVVSVTVNGETLELETAYNETDVLTFRNLSPDGLGNLLVEFTGGASGYGYLSAMALNYVVPEPNTIVLASFALLSLVCSTGRSKRGRRR